MVRALDQYLAVSYAQLTVSTSSGSSSGIALLPFVAGAFFPAPLAHGEVLALNKVDEAELIDFAKRRMSSVYTSATNLAKRQTEN
jgi:hypothetical protein